MFVVPEVMPFGGSEGYKYTEAIWRDLLIIVIEERNIFLTQKILQDKNLVDISFWKDIDTGW